MYYNHNNNCSQSDRNLNVVKCPQRGHNVTEPRPRAFAGSCASRVCPVIILEELSTSKEAEGIAAFLQQGLNSCPPGETHYCAYVSVCMRHTFDFWGAFAAHGNEANGPEHELTMEECWANFALPHDTWKPKWHVATAVSFWCNHAKRCPVCWVLKPVEKWKHPSALIYGVTQQQMIGRVMLACLFSVGQHLNSQNEPKARKHFGAKVWNYIIIHSNMPNSLTAI